MSDTIYFRNLVVHGNPDTYSGDPYGKNFYTTYYPTSAGGDPGLGPFNQYKINGTVGGIAPYNYTSHDGDPIMTMELQLSNLEKTVDKQATVQIDTASLRQLPNGYVFGYTFTLYANMIVYDDLGSNPTPSQVLNMFNNATIRTSQTLFTKPWTTDSWSDGEFKISNRLRMQAPMLQNKKIYFVISNLSQCSCSQRNKNVPVFIYDISGYYPSNPEGYFWRMQKGTDPNNPDSSSKNWHLVRPFYICQSIGGTKYWCSCEDIETPVYGPGGTHV